MRTAILICLFVVFRYAANAQFFLLPQLGFENSRNSLEFNELNSVAKNNAIPQGAIRLDYKFKKGHGPFVGIATSQSIVRFNFSDRETGMDAYKVSRGNTQLRLEGGYQLSTKPIYFKKSAATMKSSKAQHLNNRTKKGCGGYIARGTCGSKSSKATAARAIDRGSWVRIQPSLGVAYIPFTPSSEIEIKHLGAQTGYQYNAGNWKTALITGVGFEFGKNALSKFNVSINYARNISKLEQSITTESGTKLITTSLKSQASSWNLRMGIPISLHKKKSVIAKQPVIKRSFLEEKKCSQYKIQCRPRCGKVI
jgi:hypothetical protein